MDTDDALDLDRIDQQFRQARACYAKFGTGPDWEHVSAGERLLAEVRRLRAENDRLRDPWAEQPVTPDDLGEIERRFVAVSPENYSGGYVKIPARCFTEDFPRLVAEVRRLRQDTDDAIDLGNGTVTPARSVRKCGRRS